MSWGPGRRIAMVAGSILVVVGMLAPAAVSVAAPQAAAIKLKSSFGPPTSRTKVVGTGFGATEQVVITFDGTQVGTATTDGTGGFAKKVKVPASAKPGDHTVKAKGGSSGSIASKRFLVRTDWTKFHFALNNSGSNPYENVLDPSNVSGLEVAWSYPTPGMTLSSSAVVAGGVVYFGAGDSLYALDAATGAFKWSYPTGDQVVYSTPAVVKGVVYFGSKDHKVYALNALTGARKWSYKTGDVIYSSPAVANGVVYIGGWDHKVYALNAATGAFKWSYTTGDFVDSSPAVVGGVVYVGSRDDKMYALNAATGAFKCPTRR